MRFSVPCMSKSFEPDFEGSHPYCMILTAARGCVAALVRQRRQTEGPAGRRADLLDGAGSRAAPMVACFGGIGKRRATRSAKRAEVRHTAVDVPEPHSRPCQPTASRAA